MSFEGESKFFAAIDARQSQRSLLKAPWRAMLWAGATGSWFAAARLRFTKAGPYLLATAIGLSLAQFTFDNLFRPWLETMIDRSFAKKMDAIAQSEGDALSDRWWTKFLMKQRQKTPLDWNAASTPASSVPATATSPVSPTTPASPDPGRPKKKTPFKFDGTTGDDQSETIWSDLRRTAN